MRVTLGNPYPLGLPEPERRVTTVLIPDTDTEDEAFRTVTDPGGVWAHHSQVATPDWVEADDPDFAARLADYYGVVVGRPADWEEDR
jgi:hypothetical protein